MHCPAWQILCNPAFVLQYKYNRYYLSGWSWECLEDWASFSHVTLFAVFMSVMESVCVHGGTFLAGLYSRFILLQKESARFRRWPAIADKPPHASACRCSMLCCQELPFDECLRFIGRIFRFLPIPVPFGGIDEEDSLQLSGLNLVQEN